MGRTYDLLVRARGETKDAERAMAQLQRKVTNAGRGMQNAGRMMTAGLTLPILGAAAASVKLASDAGETASKMKVTFGASMPAITKQLDRFAKATGASRYELREQATTIGALLKPLNLGAKATADMSVNVTKLATDLASFNNVPVDDALNALKSGLTGETEPLKRFGILMNEAAIETEGLRLGLIKSGEELTEQQKVQARYSLILKQTKDAQSDATRTSGSFANQMKATKNALYDTGVSIGNILLPALLKLLPKIQQGIAWFNGLDATTKKWAVGIGLVAAALGPVVFMLGSFVIAAGALLPILLAITAPMIAVTAAVVALGAATAALVVHERNKQNEFKRSAEAALEQVRAMRTLKDLQTDLAGARLSVREANVSLERAERTYRDTVQQSGRKSLEAREAALSLQRARQTKAEATRRLAQVEKDANQQLRLSISTVFQAQTALRDEVKVRQRLADVREKLGNLTADASVAERNALNRQARSLATHLDKLERAHATNQKVVTEALRRGLVNRRQLMDREGAHLAPAAREAGKKAGQAMGDGFMSSFSAALSNLAAVAQRASSRANAAAGGAGRSGAGGNARAARGKAVPSGISALGQLFGPGVSVQGVLGYSSNMSGQAFETVTDASGRQSAVENRQVTDFLKERIRLSNARMQTLLGLRAKLIPKLQAARKALLRANQALKRAEKHGDKAAIRKAKDSVSKAKTNLAYVEGAIETYNSEILSLGGQINADEQALEPPAIDNSGIDKSESDKASQDARDAENLRRRALGLMSLEEEEELAAVNAIRAQNGLAPVTSTSEIAARNAAPAAGTGAAAATPPGPTQLIIRQTFTGQPDLFAASRQAAWAARTAGLVVGS
jgi:hypothetical protein